MPPPAADIWSTGQDVAATIKRQLQRLFPVVKIFLDVDDLEDLSKLEQYVGESAVVLLLLSKGYFLSISPNLSQHLAKRRAGLPVIMSCTKTGTERHRSSLLYESASARGLEWALERPL